MSDAEIDPSVSIPPLTGFPGAIPLTSQFVFTVDQLTIGAFSEVSGLEVRAEIVSYKEGGTNGYVHQLPGRFTWPNIVLKQGVINNDNLFQWMSKTAGPGFSTQGNKITYSTAAISLVDLDDSTVLRQWNFLQVFPIRWTGPRFSLSSKDEATEELEIAHHGFTSKTPGP